MSFLSPLALIGLTLVALPVIVHLLARRRAARLDFPTLRFLRETPSFRLHPRSLRQPLLLALRVLALVLLILGLARPLIAPRPSSQKTRLILLDASLSMRAPHRAEAARAEARAIINSLAQGERAALISLSTEAVALAATTVERAELLAAVEKYEPGSGPIDYNKGFAAAAALLEREAPGAAEVELISDFQQSNFTGLTAQLSRLNARVNPHAVGASLERNAFLSDEEVWKGARGVELSAAEIVSSAEGRSGARRAWTIAASAGEQPDIIWRTEANGQLTGSIKALAPDDFDADDERFFAFVPPRSARALLIETDAETSLYTGAALEAAASSFDESHALLTRQRQLPAQASDLNPYALVVLTLHGQLRADELRVLTDYAAAGGTVWLSLARTADAPQLNALAQSEAGSALPFMSLTRLTAGRAWNLGAADTAAPALRFMSEKTVSALRAIVVREGYALEPRAGADTLMRWSDGAAAFVSTRIGAGRLLLLCVSTESAASGLGSSPALPSLVYSILREAASPREPLSYTLGAAINLGVAPESSVTITEQSGRVTQAKASALMQRPLSVFKEAGIYRLETEAGARFVALNPPVSESERSLADAADVQRYFDGKEPSTPAGGKEWREAAERGGNIWRYFLGAAFLLLIAELFVRARRQSRSRLMSAGIRSES
ncbi:MAG: hypothetical protein QOF02_1350 [Blastocatellia bacterium]|jgi:hypothetical protein|nr:hypothetical protein [Blastocatellia bacterium]